MVTRVVEAKPDPENLRVEYQVAHQFFIQSMTTRFTIAGFSLAAAGLLAQIGLDADASLTQRSLASLAGFIVGVAVWILELRTRSLCRAMSNRMIAIERKYWYSEPEDWFEGTMSRAHKTDPPEDHPHHERIPEKPGPERPKVAWMKRPLPAGPSWHVTHSMGFDIIYPTLIVFWVAVFIWSIAESV